ncbi:MAG: hypothetical protein R3F48_16545 [Candidatus Zixiibacteriota bacterium]
MPGTSIMRVFISTACIGLFLFVGAKGAPQDETGGMQAKKTAVYSEKEISEGRDYLMKSVDACGGITTFKKTKNYEMTCTVNSSKQGSMQYREVKVFPDKMAQFVKTPSVTQEMYYNGSDGWTVLAGTAKPMPPTQADMMADQMKRDQFYLLMHVDDKDLIVAFKGMSDFDGQKALRIEVVLNESETYSIFLDTASYRIIGMKQETLSAMGPTTVSIALLDYKEFGGVSLPSRIEQKVGGQTVTITDISYRLDIDIDKTMFEKPSGI